MPDWAIIVALVVVCLLIEFYPSPFERRMRAKAKRMKG